MDNHNFEIENDVAEPKRPWASLLAAMLIGLLIGSLAGAVTMLLLAPRSGKKTRARLQRQSHELAEQTAGTVEDAVAQALVKARQMAQEVRM